MPDIFDQVADKKPAKADIFDQVAAAPSVPLPKIPTPLPEGLQGNTVGTTLIGHPYGGGAQPITGTPQEIQRINENQMAMAQAGMVASAAPAAAAAPAATALSAILGYGGSKGLEAGGRAVGKAMGASPATQYNLETGGQMVGGLAGGILGGEAPALSRMALRSIAGKVYMPSGELSAWADALVHPTKIPETALRKIIPENPEVAMARTESQANELRAQDLMRRGKEQSALDSAAARESAKAAKAAAAATKQGAATPTGLFPGATPSNVPVGNAQLPQAQGMPQGSATPFGQPQMVSNFTPPGSSTPEPSRIVLPGSTPPNVKVTYQSYKREQLYEMAKTGNIDAGLELLRNPKGFDLPPNFKFLIEEGAKLQPWRNLKE
jgi:hypothetical protein